MSDLLLDGTHLWFQTHKMSEDYSPMHLPRDKVIDIIQRWIIVEKKFQLAITELLQIEPIKAMFTTQKDIIFFSLHARRYLNMYLPLAGFEISQTDRYAAVTNKSEACVIATRAFEVGSQLQLCSGTVAGLTEQEEQELEALTKDFSVIKTSTKGTCLFLGPARFVNHDCDANCRFVRTGHNTISFKVVKPIRVNDEITTDYGPNYFGKKNRECLCATCERRGRGGYAPPGTLPEEGEVPSEETIDPLSDERKLRNRVKPINYYPKLKLSAKQTRTPPKTASPPAELDIVSHIVQPLTPDSQVDSGSSVDQPTPSRVFESDGIEAATPELDSNSSELERLPDNSSVVSASTPSSLPECDLAYEMDDDVTLVSLMESLSLEKLLGLRTSPRTNENLAQMDNSLEPQVSSQIDQLDTPRSRNFRMSFDFLCHGAMDPQGNSAAAAAENNPESATKKRVASRRKRKGALTNINPNQCKTCRIMVTTYPITSTRECRRCHRHFSIYGEPWPSRRGHVIAERYLAERREEERKEKAAHDALMAEQKKKRREAAKKRSKAGDRPLVRKEFSEKILINMLQKRLVSRTITGSIDLSTIITEDHPYHHCPYVVFVDPQDEQSSRFWWIAVTVPRDQVDSTMPDIGRRKDGSIDPDLIIVRFLEDNKYSICNISGLKLFHPDQEPYKGYVSSFGREFMRTISVRRALGFIHGDVPSGFLWRNMSCHKQLSLHDVAEYTREIEARVQHEVNRFRKRQHEQPNYQRQQQDHMERPRSSSQRAPCHEYPTSQSSQPLTRINIVQHAQRLSCSESGDGASWMAEESADAEGVLSTLPIDPLIEEAFTLLELLHPPKQRSKDEHDQRRRGPGKKTLKRKLLELQEQLVQRGAETSPLSQRMADIITESLEEEDPIPLETTFEEYDHLQNDHLQNDYLQNDHLQTEPDPPILQEESAGDGSTFKAIIRSKSQAKPGSVTWWPMELPNRIRRPTPALLNPREERGVLQSSRFGISDLLPRFTAVSSVLTSNQTPTLSAEASKQFELQYQRLEQSICEISGSVDSSRKSRPRESTSSRKNPNPTPRRAPGKSQAKRPRTVGSNRQDANAEDEPEVVGSSNTSETLSTAPSYNTSIASSRMQSSASSVILDEDGETDVVEAGDLANTTFSKIGPHVIVDNTLVKFRFGTMGIASLGGLNRSVKRRARDDTPQSCIRSPKRPRSEIDKLQEWTIKNSLPTETARLRRKAFANDISLSDSLQEYEHSPAPDQPQQPLPRKKTEVEVLAQWTIKNSLLDIIDEDCGRITRSAREQLAKSGVKRSRTEATNDDTERIPDSPLSPKTRRAEQYPGPGAPSKATELVTLAIQSPSSSSRKGNKKKSKPKEIIIKPLDLVGSNRELSGLMQWTIKDSTFNLDASTQAKLRSLRISTNVITLNTTAGDVESTRSKTATSRKGKAVPITFTPDMDDSQERRSFRTLLKQVNAKLPNTIAPKYRVGDQLQAPAEDDVLFDSTILAIRDHKMLQNVYEYRVHYIGYSPRFDAWIEEKLLVPE